MLKPYPFAHAALSWVLSLSLSLSPLFPVAAHAQARPLPDEPDAATMTAGLKSLLDRAMYPNVPRAGRTGMPTGADLATLQLHLNALKHSLDQTVAEKLSESDPRDLSTLETIGLFYESASRFEGLKIFLGQGNDPSAWSIYTLRVPLRNLTSYTLVEVLSYFAKHFTPLPIEGLDVKDEHKEHFFSEIVWNGREWEIRLHLNPDFAAKYERLALFARPGLKSALQYAVHFTADQLYDSQALTHVLQRKDPATLPEPDPLWRERYISMRVKRAENIRHFNKRAARTQKPLIFKAVLDAADAANTWVLDETLHEFRRLTGQPDEATTPEQLSERRATEKSNFAHAVSGLVNMMEIPSANRGVPTFIVYQAQRLSLRTLLLTNIAGDQADLIPEGVRPQVEALIDTQAKKFTDSVIAQGKLQAEVSLLQGRGMGAYLESNREKFQERLEKASASLRDFMDQPINLGYLERSAQAKLKALGPGPMVSSVIQAIAQQPSYQAAYEGYKKALLDYLRAFRSPKPLPEPLTIKAISAAASSLEFDPSRVKSEIPAEFAGHLNPPSGSWLPKWFAPAPPRKKDLNDLIQVGEILKFDVFETLKDVPATPRTLKLDNYFFGGFFAQEKKGYLDEMRIDLMNAAPLLGAIPDSRMQETVSEAPNTDSRMLYERLVDPNLSADEKVELTENQLAAVIQQIQTNTRKLNAEIGKVDGVHGQSTSGVGHEVLTLATRASQISLSLQSFASFSSHFEQLQQELMLPGFVRREWQQFNSWTANAGLFFLAFWGLQFASSRVPLAGRLAQSTSTTIAPVFGANLSGLNMAFFGLLGAGVSDQLYRGFIEEPAYLDTIRRYFDSGSGAGVVATYGDVLTQTERMNQPRREAQFTVLFTALVVGGLWLAGKLASKFTYFSKIGSTARALERIKEDKALLGLGENASLSQPNLQAALQDSLRKARSISDPVERELAEMTVRQAYARIERQIYHEGLKWSGDYSNRSAMQRLRLSKNEWRDPSALARALDQLERDFTAGRIASSEYHHLKSVLVTVYRKAAPAWEFMEKNPLAEAYFQRVWGTTNGISPFELKLHRTRFENQLAPRFTAKLNQHFGRDLPANTDRLDALLERIAQETMKNPELTRERLNELRSLLHQEMKR